jgi:hypothetical protein
MSSEISLLDRTPPPPRLRETDIGADHHGHEQQ